MQSEVWGVGLGSFRSVEEAGGDALVVIHDITARRQAEEACEPVRSYSAAWWRFARGNRIAGNVGGILFANHRIGNVWIPTEEVIGKNSSELVSSDLRRRTEMPFKMRQSTCSGNRGKRSRNELWCAGAAIRMKSCGFWRVIRSLPRMGTGQLVTSFSDITNEAPEEALTSCRLDCCSYRRRAADAGQELARQLAQSVLRNLNLRRSRAVHTA